MNVLVYLIPMALGLGLIGLFGFLWALRSGQYSDVDGAALRVLSDDDIEQKPPSLTAATKAALRPAVPAAMHRSAVVEPAVKDPP